ncbi:MAG: methylamine utilization protein [Gammaproteobacteria bacterium]
MNRYPRLLLYVLTMLAQPVLAQQLTLTITDDEGSPLPDVVVEVLLDGAQSNSAGEPAMFEIDQLDKEFVPSVTAITVGSQVSFPNSDDILHHVYSFSPARTFNIPLYGRGENNSFFETFNQPGLVEIGCNIHDWMLAYIYVAESELSAISNEQGIAVLNGIPAGEHSIRIWHSRMAATEDAPEQRQRFVAGQPVSLTVALELQRDRRVRRAPTNNRNRYR